MFFNILYSIIVSITIIFVVDNIFNYFKNTLTTPKIKDLINKPKNEYDKIKSVIGENENINIIRHDNLDKTTSEIINNSNPGNVDHNNIKSELKDFFKQLNEEKKDNNLYTSEYDTLNSNSAFSNFNLQN